MVGHRSLTWWVLVARVPLRSRVAHINIVVVKAQRQSHRLTYESIDGVKRPEDALAMLLLANGERRKPSRASMETKLEGHSNDHATKTTSSVETKHGNEKELDADGSLQRKQCGGPGKRVLQAIYRVIVRLEDKLRRILRRIKHLRLPAVSKRYRHDGSEYGHLEI